MTTKTETRELPILFSGPMVRAILEGRKTQTRRVVKWSEKSIEHDRCELHELKDGTFWPYNCCDEWERPIRCPYGRPGDRLWVRETCRYHSFDAAGVHVEYKADGRVEVAADARELFPTDVLSLKFNERINGEKRWRPSIHMPRWASRITLEVTGVRVERVKDITTRDCIREGITKHEGVRDGVERDEFAALWDSINGKTYPWEDNPWCWCISFSRVDK